MGVLLVLTNLPDRASAEEMARAIVDARLAACVTILSEATSIYRWNGKREEAREVPVLMKTTSERYAALESGIHDAHPYELPEIIAVPVEKGLPAYLGWVITETRESE